MVHHVPGEKSKTVIFWLQHKLWCVYRPYKAKLPNSQAAGRGKRKDKDFRFSRLFLKALNFQRLIQRFFKEIVQKTGKNSHFLSPLPHGEIFKKNFVQSLYTPTKKYPGSRDFLRQISTVFGNFLKKYLRYREVIYLIGKPSFSAFRRSKDIRCGYPHKIATPL